MKHYGAEPPWRGVTRYGSWRIGEEQWLGPVEWVYVEPPNNFTVYEMSQVLRRVYIPAIKESLNGGAFLRLMERAT